MIVFSLGCGVRMISEDPVLFSGGGLQVVEKMFHWAPDTTCSQNSTNVRVCVGPSNDNVCLSENDTLTKRTPPRLAVVVIAANRPQYFQRVLGALKNQQAGGAGVPPQFDVHLFIDFCKENEEVQQLAREFQETTKRHYGPKTYIRSNYTKNQGIARLTWEALVSTFETFKYDQIVLLEEDHVVGSNYVSTMSLLLTLSDEMNAIGVVTGNLLNYSHHSQRQTTLHVDSSCRFQVAPLDGFTALASHNVWAWGMSRRKFVRMRDLYADGLRRTGLLDTSYAWRNTRKIARWMRQNCGRKYHHWQGQDWVRACALSAVGMPYKLQTIDRTLQYIGRTGLHTSESSFDSKHYVADDPEPTQRFDSIVQDMCERLCYADVLDQ